MKKITAVSSILLGLIFSAGCSLQQAKNQSPAPATTTDSTLTQTKVTIFVPSDVPAYEKAMNAYVSNGGQDPSRTWPFIKKTLVVAYTNDLIRASAEAAAGELIPYGGPAKASIAYFKLQNSTAFTLLDIDLDGWAGVSFSLAKIHPLVEKTLLQFSQIKNVVFHYAPGDDQLNNAPRINSITPASGPKGTTVEIRGTGLSGLEGDLDVYFEKDDGKKVMLTDTFGDYAITQDKLIKVKVGEPCQKGEKVIGRYSGVASVCDYVELTPGVYKVLARADVFLFTVNYLISA